MSGPAVPFLFYSLMVRLVSRSEAGASCSAAQKFCEDGAARKRMPFPELRGGLSRVVSSILL